MHWTTHCLTLEAVRRFPAPKGQPRHSCYTLVAVKCKNKIESSGRHWFVCRNIESVTPTTRVSDCSSGIILSECEMPLRNYCYYCFYYYLHWENHWHREIVVKLTKFRPVFPGLHQVTKLQRMKPTTNFMYKSWKKASCSLYVCSKIHWEPRVVAREGHSLKKENKGSILHRWDHQTQSLHEPRSWSGTQQSMARGS